IELLDDAAQFRDMMHLSEIVTLERELERRGSGKRKAKEPAANATEPSCVRTMRIVYGCGFMLNVKTDGWKLFCQRNNFPPFVVFKELLGFERLERAWGLAKSSAFKADGMVNWINSIRPEGEPEIEISQIFTPERIANSNDALFRQRIEWWGG